MTSGSRYSSSTGYVRRPSFSREFSKPSLWVIICRPSFLAMAPSLLYSSQVCFTASSVVTLFTIGPLMLAMLMWVMPMSCAHWISVGRLVRTPRKCALGHFMPLSSRIFRTRLPSVRAWNSPLGDTSSTIVDADRLQVLEHRRKAIVAVGSDPGAVRPHLTANRQPERAGVERDAVGNHERQRRGRAARLLQKISSGNAGHNPPSMCSQPVRATGRGTPNRDALGTRRLCHNRVEMRSSTRQRSRNDVGGNVLSVSSATAHDHFRSCRLTKDVRPVVTSRERGSHVALKDAGRTEQIM